MQTKSRIHEVLHTMKRQLVLLCASLLLKLSIDGDDTDADGMVEKLYLHCEECGATTEVLFEKGNGDRTSYITGKVVE